MNAVQRLEHWGEAHHPRYMDIIRIALGVFLCMKGMEFARNSNLLPEILSRRAPFSNFMLIILQHYIIFAHIVGGFMLAAGFLTRVACLAQIPVLIGAIIFANWGMTAHFSDILIALLVLALLVWFFIIGSGPWSLDNALTKEELQ